MTMLNIFNYRFSAILKRELKEGIFSRKFLFMTLSMPAIMLVMFGVMYLVNNFDRQERSVLHILNESSDFQSLIVDQAADSDMNNAALYELHYEIVRADEVDTYVESHRSALLSGDITGILFIPDSARDDKQVSYYSSNPGNQNLAGRIREVINRAVVGEYFRKLNVDTSAVAYARSNVVIDGVRVTEQGNTDSGFANLIVAFVFTLLMYISLLSMGPSVMGAVNEEKTNRVVEVLLSSVTSDELMAGKIAGTAIAGLFQMIIWLSPLILLGLVSLPALAMSGALDFELSALDVLYFLINYLFGVLIFTSIFAAFGAMFDTPQDAQASMMPVMMLIIIPFFLAMSMAQNPANALAEVSSMLPFTNLLVMPGRMTLIDVPLWQLLLTTAVNALTLYFCIRFVAKIYRTAFLLTGKKPSFRETIKWLRYE